MIMVMSLYAVSSLDGHQKRSYFRCSPSGSVVALMSRVDEAESAISGFLELTGDIASLATGGAILAMGKGRS